MEFAPNRCGMNSLADDSYRSILLVESSDVILASRARI
jgi:hypothetical protein